MCYWKLETVKRSLPGLIGCRRRNECVVPFCNGWRHGYRCPYMVLAQPRLFPADSNDKDVYIYIYKVTSLKTFGSHRSEQCPIHVCLSARVGFLTSLRWNVFTQAASLSRCLPWKKNKSLKRRLLLCLTISAAKALQTSLPS